MRFAVIETNVDGLEAQLTALLRANTGFTVTSVSRVWRDGAYIVVMAN